MNRNLVEQKIVKYLNDLEKNGNKQKELKEREKRKKFYQSYDKYKILNMSEDELYSYIDNLWAISFWTDSKIYIDQCIGKNGFDNLKKNIAKFLYENKSIETKWTEGMKIKKFGKAFVSELLCYSNPNEYSIFNGTTENALRKIGVELPKKENADTYLKMCDYAKEIGKMISEKTNEPCDLLFVDYFLYEIAKDKTNFIDGKPEIKEKNNRKKTELEKSIKLNIYQNDKLIDDIVEVLDNKKNIILTGVPGVGKTHVAFDIIKLFELNDNGKLDNDLGSRIVFTQFHQNYGYEEFVEGMVLENGKLEPKDGIFKKLVNDALNDENNNYYIIIDEINRGNISKIFGELLMCIESDKRSSKYSVSLMYSKMKSNQPKFYIPENIYIIGTMNTADRSLEPIDYALRRRFSFFHLEAAFNNEKFQKILVNNPLGKQILDTMNHINRKLKEYFGSSNFNIGHSYFLGCKKIDEKQFIRILKYDIIPLLKEYMVDCTNKEIYEKFKSDEKNMKFFNSLLEELRKDESN